MSNRDQSSYSTHALYGNVNIHDGFSTARGQASSLNDPPQLPPEATFVQRHNNDVNSIIQSLDIYRQRLHVNVEAMRELYHCLQKMMENTSIRISELPQIPENDACQLFTELGSRTGGELGAHAPHSVNMNTLRPTDAPHVVEVPMYNSATDVQLQMRASSHSAQIELLHRERENLHFQGEISERIAPSYPQLATSAYGCNFEVDLEDISQSRMNPTAFVNTVEVGNGHTQSSMVGSQSPREESTVSSFISGGIKRYRCGCGFESDSKRRMDRHRDSLRHSGRKYGCSCGKLFTRADSLKRHKKRCGVM